MDVDSEKICAALKVAFKGSLQMESISEAEKLVLEACFGKWDEM